MVSLHWRFATLVTPVLLVRWPCAWRKPMRSPSGASTSTLTLRKMVQVMKSQRRAHSPPIIGQRLAVWLWRTAFVAETMISLQTSALRKDAASTRSLYLPSKTSTTPSLLNFETPHHDAFVQVLIRTSRAQPPPAQPRLPSHSVLRWTMPPATWTRIRGSCVATQTSRWRSAQLWDVATMPTTNPSSRGSSPAWSQSSRMTLQSASVQVTTTELG
mmetsp:Transcript_30321/g.70740  ORF Transcript_30321/g.70740 Transcript_30321/m.70740 type:complete len:215 (+) Transcript_30321:2807-3451(+)